MGFVSRATMAAAVLLVLSACDSSEERAEKHFQSGVALLESGDLPRAMVEFRNTLALDNGHREARASYARAAREQGNVSEAYSNFLRLAEQFPDDMEARLALTEIAILAQNWDEAERHGAALIEANAQLDGTDIATLALAFRQAVLDEDNPTVRELTRRAETLLETNPNDQILIRVLIEGYLAESRIDDAIAVNRGILDSGTDNPIFYQIMAELLIAKGDLTGLEQHFRDMIAQFPDDEDTKGNLLRLLVTEGRSDQAEAFLRDEIETAEDKVAAHVTLVALIRQLRGDDAALAEIDLALNTYDNPPLVTALKAGLLFDRGEQDAAVALMESITEGQEPSARVDDFRVTLAKMLVARSNEIGARQLVEAVLEHDSSHVEALKMRASWQIDADETDAAIATLRLALDREPDDAEAMTIMARAHERNGDTQLAQDLLALAVEASGFSPAESLRFARIQLAEERYASAEETLISALRRAPGHLELLSTLGQVYLATADWSRADQVVRTIRRQDSARAGILADELQLQLISSREGRDQGIGFLEQLVQNGSDTTAAKVALIQARLQENRADDALALAQGIVDENPGELPALMVLGNTQVALAAFAEAETTFRAALEINPNNTMTIVQLLRTLNAQGRSDEAEALVDASLQAQPEHPDLLWAKASFLEQSNDIDGAIGVYEQLYALNSNNQVIANNLASLLVTYRTEQTDLDRATAVGKRLRGTEFPPFQDTYGWLLYRQGQFEEAVTYLEPAARALAGDPIVQFHLAKAYLALGRDADALAQFESVTGLADEDDPRPQIAEARSEVERLKTISE